MLFYKIYVFLFQHHLAVRQRGKKIAFIVDKNNLANQQSERILEFIPCSLKVISGDIQREEENVQDWDSLIPKYDLLNFLNNFKRYLKYLYHLLLIIILKLMFIQVIYNAIAFHLFLPNLNQKYMSAFSDQRAYIALHFSTSPKDRQVLTNVTYM